MDRARRGPAVWGRRWRPTVGPQAAGRLHRCAKQTQFGPATRAREARGGRAKQTQFQAGGGRPEAGAGLPTAYSLQSPAWKTPNKANPGRGGLGIDYGLWIIDDLRPETPMAGLRQTKPIWPAQGREIRNSKPETRNKPE